MNSVLLAPLIIGEPPVPAFHYQLELLISWDSGMVTRHFRYLHKNVMKCSHLSMKSIVFQSKCLHLTIYHYEVFGGEAPATLTLCAYFVTGIKYTFSISKIVISKFLPKRSHLLSRTQINHTIAKS